MKANFIFFLILCSVALSAQTNSILRMERTAKPYRGPVSFSSTFLSATLARHEKAPGTAAFRHGLAMVILGPIKVTIGAVNLAYCLETLFAGGTGDGFVVGITGATGAFHILTGAALTAGGVILLRKAKKQRTAGSSNVYLNLPDTKLYSTYNGSTPVAGIGTGITF